MATESFHQLMARYKQLGEMMTVTHIFILFIRCQIQRMSLSRIRGMLQLAPGSQKHISLINFQAREDESLEVHCAGRAGSPVRWE